MNAFFDEVGVPVIHGINFSQNKLFTNIKNMWTGNIPEIW